MENETKAYLQFLPITEDVLQVLWLEKEADFKVLQNNMPNAKHFFLQEKLEGNSAKIDDAAVCWIDFLNARLSCEDNFFDYIVVGNYAEKVSDLNVFYQQMFVYLKKSGKIIANFFNARHWQRIQAQMEGGSVYVNDETQNTRTALFWSDILTLFENNKYQEIKADPLYKRANPQFLEQLLHNGFKNENQDLETVSWAIQACKIEEKAEYLQQFFSSEIRRKLVFFLRRIEFEIDINTNCKAVWKLCEANQIPMQYVIAFAGNTLLQSDKVLPILAASANNKAQRWQGILLLQNMFEDGEHTVMLCMVLGSLLYLQEEYDMAENVLLSCENPNKEIDELLQVVRRDKNAK